MEKGLIAASGKMSMDYVDANDPIANELNDQEFKDFAFNTHYSAYWNAGYENITTGDFWKLVDIIDWHDRIDINAFKDFISLEETQRMAALPLDKQQENLKVICSEIIGRTLSLCEKNG